MSAFTIYVPFYSGVDGIDGPVDVGLVDVGQRIPRVRNQRVRVDGDEVGEVDWIGAVGHVEGDLEFVLCSGADMQLIGPVLSGRRKSQRDGAVLVERGLERFVDQIFLVAVAKRLVGVTLIESLARSTMPLASSLPMSILTCVIRVLL